MRIGSLHVIDIGIVFAYLLAVVYIGKRAAAGNNSEEGFFLAGRKLGKLYQFFLERNLELLNAAGATRTWAFSLDAPWQVHLLGTCRMGNDPKASVVDKFHRAHDVPNLFIVDGSSFVTCGTGQPTMTIQALAFRAAEHIARFARSHEI